MERRNSLQRWQIAIACSPSSPCKSEFVDDVLTLITDGRVACSSGLAAQRNVNEYLLCGTTVIYRIAPRAVMLHLPCAFVIECLGLFVGLQCSLGIYLCHVRPSEYKFQLSLLYGRKT